MRSILALIAVLALLVVAGCGGPTRRPGAEPVAPTSSSVEVTAGVTLEVSIDSSSLPASTDQTATVTVRNDSSKEVTIEDIWAVRILDSSGNVIWDPMADLRYLTVRIVLPPKGTKTRQLHFEVPTQGSYELQVYLWGARPEASSTPIPFESVAPQSSS